MYAHMARDRAWAILLHYGCSFVGPLANGTEAWKAADGYVFVMNLVHPDLYDEHMIRQVLTMTLEIEIPDVWPV